MSENSFGYWLLGLCQGDGRACFGFPAGQQGLEQNGLKFMVVLSQQSQSCWGSDSSIFQVLDQLCPSTSFCSQVGHGGMAVSSHPDEGARWFEQLWGYMTWNGCGTTCWVNDCGTAHLCVTWVSVKLKKLT